MMNVGSMIVFVGTRGRLVSAQVESVGERFLFVRVTFAEQGAGYKPGDRAAVPHAAAQPLALVS